MKHSIMKVQGLHQDPLLKNPGERYSATLPPLHQYWTVLEIGNGVNLFLLKQSSRWDRTVAGP